MEKDISNFCYEAKKPAELPETLMCALKNPKTERSILKKHQEEMLYKLDGLASERAKKEIINRL